MNIQSLSVVVPNAGCWNRCPFCVSRMHCEDYGKSIIKPDEPLPHSYIERMQYVRDEGCNAMVITGDSEPQQDMNFIGRVLRANRTRLDRPFRHISIQTTGSGLTEDDVRMLANFGITTVSLSISSFDSVRNAEIIGMPEKIKRDFYDVQRLAKNAILVTRASVNLTSEFADLTPTDYFDWANANGFDQITFRKIYADGDTCQSRWISEHKFPYENYEAIVKYVETEGTPLLRLPFGHIKYSVHGVSTVIDDNCMAKDDLDNLKYAILRPNGHLYSRWDDKGSLIF